MAKLSDFAGTILNMNQNKNTDSKNEQYAQSSMHQQPRSEASGSDEDLMKKYNELKDLPEDELSKKLVQEAAKQKKDGTFDYEAIASMLSNVKGMVPEESYQNMLRILETLR